MPLPRTRLMSTFSPQAWYGAGEFFAPNPDWNAEVSYYLRSAANGRAEVTISDASGKTIRTLAAPAASGMNHVVWDLRYAPPVDSGNVPTGGGRGGRGGRGGPPAATPVGFPGAGAGGGGRGGVPVGPLVMPGTYGVRVTIPGIARPLTGRVVVEADPLPNFKPATRGARQIVLMRIYEWSQALGSGRVAAKALAAQRDSIAADLRAGGAADAGARADSLNARVTRVSTDIDRAFTAVNAQRGPIEGWSGLPTIDQRKAVGYAIEGAQKAMTELNTLVSSDIPSAYRSIAKRGWTRAVKPVALPVTAKGKGT
jgi:hypothetical protein